MTNGIEKVGYLEMSQDVYERFRTSLFPRERWSSDKPKVIPYDVRSYVDEDGSWEIVIVDGEEIGPNKVLFTKRAA
jgi:hypothetical protein